MQSDNLILIKNTSRKTHDISNDYTLPDYIPDVKRLANTDTRAVLHNVYINHNSIVYEGEVIYTALLICEDECIRNAVYSEEFSIEVNSDTVDNLKCHECIAESSSIRLISPRKINCKTKVSLFSKNIAEQHVSPQYANVMRVEDESTFEKRFSQYEYMNIDEKSINSLHASHDIELSQDKEEISSIIYCKVDIFVNEQKHLENKLYLRGEVLVSILYESVNASYVKTKMRFPFSEIVDDIEGFNGCMCRVDVNDIRAAVRNNSFGEMKQIELDYTYNIVCRTYSTRTAEVINDIYSTAYDTDCTYGTVTPMRFNSVIFSNLSIEGEYGFEESEDVDTRIVDCICSVEDSSVSVDMGKLQVIGTLKCDVILNSDSLTHHSYSLPIKFEKTIDERISEVYSEYRIAIGECKGDINKNKIYVSAELMLSVMIAESYECKYVASVETKPIENTDTSPMIIYYPGKDEILWDVAKKFKSTCSDIMSTNNMDSESLENIKVLLLPKKNRKAVKSMII